MHIQSRLYRFSRQVLAPKNPLVTRRFTPKVSQSLYQYPMRNYSANFTNFQAVNAPEFAGISQDIQKLDEKREVIIKRSREILKASKQAIFALHRKDTASASSKLQEAEIVIKDLASLINSDPVNLKVGAFTASLEEYVEAKCFETYLHESVLLPFSAVTPFQVAYPEYIGGVIDFTGELVRYAIARATVREVEEVKKAQCLVQLIAEQLVEFDFRNGFLRKKYDSLKYNLQKLENTLYELSLVTASGVRLQPAEKNNIESEKEET
uniref:Uncharacterized protein AlNc14C475G11856 n=1 Tax=Albugo laibachii Nc14 TaxID=890382 RepID=F0X0B9_9STRA|nr:conserved hypothetical protein [Albugo laibachii Nc14]|eukprot:CCA27202.1 conserved hypothetical protein [Albugo laibachii Nc14]